jgi:hypothetical protein
MDYVVILEKGKKSFGAYVPDLPGCVAVGKTKREALRLIREAIPSLSQAHPPSWSASNAVPPPNTALQRTRSAPLRSPLSFRTLGNPNSNRSGDQHN